MRRSYYSASITDFLSTSETEVLGELANANPFALDPTQKSAWVEQVTILKRVLTNRTGRIYFEYAIPRMGKRIDGVLIMGPVVFVLEFKVGESHFNSSALDQVTDYCLDLKNFHETSLDHFIAPVLIATASRHIKPIVCETRGSGIRDDIDRGSSPTIREGLSDETEALLDSRATAPDSTVPITTEPWFDEKVLTPIRSVVPQLGEMIDEVLRFASADPDIDPYE